MRGVECAGQARRSLLLFADAADGSGCERADHDAAGNAGDKRTNTTLKVDGRKAN